MALAPERLGSRLKAEREARGLTLHQIAGSTKIPVMLLEALERDDVSRWPKGLYRRAFFRSYVTALGLKPDPLAEEFAKLFPDGSDAKQPEPPRKGPAKAVNGSALGEPLALTFAARSGARSLGRSVVVAIAEVAGVLGVGALVAWTASMTLLTASGVIALIYYPIARVAAGRVRRQARIARHSAPVKAVTAPLPRPAGAPAEPLGTPAAPRRTIFSQVRSSAASAVRRMGGVYQRITRRWLPVAQRGASATGAAALHAWARTGRLLKDGVVVTSGAVTRVAGWTGMFMWREGVRVARGARRATSETARVCVIVARAVNRAFWRGVRAASEYAQLLAAKQLDRSKQ